MNKAGDQFFFSTNIDAYNDNWPFPSNLYYLPRKGELVEVLGQPPTTEVMGLQDP